MREIKFRAWDKKNKYMYLPEKVKDYRGWFQDLVSWNDDGESGACIDLSIAIYDKNLILMQYTGLKDKNGKEICEGDIIKFETDMEGKCIEEVYWREKEGAFYHTYSDRPPKRFWNTKIEIEVIGNIYENPELANK